MSLSPTLMIPMFFNFTPITRVPSLSPYLKTRKLKKPTMEVYARGGTGGRRVLSHFTSLTPKPVASIISKSMSLSSIATSVHIYLRRKTGDMRGVFMSVLINSCTIVGMS